MCYVLYFVCVCVCYAMGHAAWNKSYDDDDDDEILHPTSLPGFADWAQQIELNQTLPNGGL